MGKDMHVTEVSINLGLKFVAERYIARYALFQLVGTELC
jgi:hypothetical protein